MRFNDEKATWLDLVEEALGPEQLHLTKPVKGRGGVDRYAYVWLQSCPEIKYHGNINHGINVDQVNVHRWVARVWGCGREIELKMTEAPNQDKMVALMILTWECHEDFVETVRRVVG